MNRAATLLLCPTLLLAEDPHAGHDHDHHDHDHGHAAHLAGSAHHPHLDLKKESNDWFHFHPHLNAAFAVGGSTSEKNFGLIRGSHAPIDDTFNLQGIELGAVMEFGERISVHANHNVFWDRFDGWDSEWEEAFAAVDLPGNLVLRGGQFFAPFGHENTLHLHDRQFVEPPISMIRLLGEEGLVVQGAELSWPLPGTNDRWLLRLGYGQGRNHGHGATRELRREAYFEGVENAGEHHDEEEDHDHDHEEEGHEHHGHGFAGNGGVYDAEDAYLDDGFFFGRLEARPEWKGVKSAGISFAAGENGFGRTTWTAGADVFGEYEAAGRPAWWRSEVFYRSVEARDRAGIKGDYDEFGIYAASGVEFAKDWTTGARIEWASGNRMSGNERRWRAAANVGRAFHLGSHADIHTRLQYTYDRLGGYADEHSVWLQFVLNLGAAEHGHSH
ncbi:hypothetical protein OKA04_06655 [Luteolibacter flavescens]|uniref:TonB-dependent receptor n=1 Tax=Luteolibacter flavescens TaxID=1859460 RepID=A0ABT3FLG7_9BACT|nr:hypothetical protein [Luteolibacter flavescens]MCW1884405.1 hypothetical protein [Luteolibacter flavescens]